MGVPLTERKKPPYPPWMNIGVFIIIAYSISMAAERNNICTQQDDNYAAQYLSFY
jgi:hypothetical protein